MKRVAAGAHLPTPGRFEPAKRPDDRADYCLDYSSLPQCKHRVLIFTLEWSGRGGPIGEQLRGFGSMSIFGQLNDEILFEYVREYRFWEFTELQRKKVKQLISPLKFCSTRFLRKEANSEYVARWEVWFFGPFAQSWYSGLVSRLGIAKFATVISDEARQDVYVFPLVSAAIFSRPQKYKWSIQTTSTVFFSNWEQFFSRYS